MGPRLIGREDEDVSQAVREILEAEGIKSRLNAKCISLAKHPSGVVVKVTCKEGAPEVMGSHVLLMAVLYHFVPNDLRRHRLISIRYISLLPCHRALLAHAGFCR